MQLFCVCPTIFLKKFNFSFAHENIKKTPSKVTYFFFSIANQPKDSPNLFLFHKNGSLRFYIMTFH